MRKIILATLAALVTFSPANADQLLGQSPIDNSSRVILPSSQTFGRWQGNKYTASPEALTLPQTDQGSTGDAGGLSVTSPMAGGQPYEMSERDADGVQVMGFIPRAMRAAIRACTSTDDLTSYIQAALSTGKSVDFAPGCYPIRDKLTASAQGQRLHGAGAKQSQLIVGPSFNLSATSVLVLPMWGEMANIGIAFDQSAATTRANAVRYPWAVEARFARIRLDNVIISGAWNGINANGAPGTNDTGGLTLRGAQVGALGTGLILNGAYDTVAADEFHCWIYGFEGLEGLVTAYGDGATICMDIGRVDDLKIGKALALRSAVKFRDMGQGGALGTIDSLALDGTNAGLNINGAGHNLTIANLYKSAGSSSDGSVLKEPGIKVSGGASVSFVNYAQAVGGRATTLLTVSGAGTRAKVLGGSFGISGADTVAAEVSTGAMLTIAGVDFRAVAGVARGTPMVRQKDTGSLVFLANTTEAKGAGSGALVEVQVDGAHVISGNAFNAWDMQAPSNPLLGLYEGNSGIGTALGSGQYVGARRMKILNGTFDANGQCITTHHVPGLNTRHPVIATSSFSDENGARTMQFPAIQTVDGTTIVTATGKTALNGQVCEIRVQFD